MLQQLIGRPRGGGGGARDALLESIKESPAVGAFGGFWWQSFAFPARSFDLVVVAYSCSTAISASMLPVTSEREREGEKENEGERERKREREKRKRKSDRERERESHISAAPQSLNPCFL